MPKDLDTAGDAAVHSFGGLQHKSGVDSNWEALEKSLGN